MNSDEQQKSFVTPSCSITNIVYGSYLYEKTCKCGYRG
jgi:hypothetical protein